ncbi:MAG: transcriptional regulator [Sphingobacteriales bacterium]|nr:MAG: transcriptional regulator [Sphingobacteriales bacterium]
MTRIKETSTIQENKKQAFQECPITFVMERIGGYWKPVILFHLLTGEKRYGEIRKALPNITEKLLSSQLKQLEEDGLVTKEVFRAVPPRVTYRLTGQGAALQPVLYAMAVWAVDNGFNGGRKLEGFPGVRSEP